MEAYKIKASQNETQIIQHIKQIAKDLLQGEYYERPKHLRRNGKDQDDKCVSKEFVRTNKHQGKYKQFSFSPNAQKKTYLSSTLPNSRSKSKRKPIFTNFDDLWSKCKQSPPKAMVTPIMERINKNIYNKFKTQSRTSADLSQNILNISQRQQHWNDFLKRQEQWRREKDQNLRQKQMKGMARQSPQLRKRINTASNLRYEDQKAERQMSAVEISLKRLKLQTEKLKQKILKIDNQQEYRSKRLNK